MQNVTPNLAISASTDAGRACNSQRLLGVTLASLALFLLPLTASAEAIPALNILEVSDDGTEYSLSLQLLLLMTVLPNEMQIGSLHAKSYLHTCSRHQ